MRVGITALLITTSLIGTIDTSPNQDLEQEIVSFGLALGVDVEASAVAGLSTDAAVALHGLLVQVRVCHDLSQELVGDLQDVGMPNALDLAPTWDGVMRDCLDATTPLLHEAARAAGDEPTLDLWPVLLLETDGQDNKYVHDYVVLIDLGGDDVYRNNAGGNVLDVTNGPGTDGAIGCQTVAEAFAGQCAISASAFLDADGNDRYGKKQQPDADSRCTTDRLVRRIVTQGSGVAGVGVLVDKLGDDVYKGKTISQGAGHLFGAGYHREEKGDDKFLAIRQSQGAGLVGGFGFLDDLGGNDTYRDYMPTGGVVDDTDVCDDVPRYTLGAGTMGGIGWFNGEGSPVTDKYVGPEMSMGHGDLGGTGMFHDRMGDDTYRGPAYAGNDRTVINTFLDTGVNIFMDHATG